MSKGQPRNPSRRRFMVNTGAAALTYAGLGSPMARAQVEQTETLRWTNWSGSVSFTPKTIERPTSEAALQQLVADATKNGKIVRAAGAGHSFVPLCRTEDVLVSLDKYQKTPRIDPAAGLATVNGGTRFYEVGPWLWEQGFALENMGDIDRQAIAGAIATGTHGTGRDFGSLATMVAGLRIVTASGDIVECSETERPDLFRAAVVSLGALGLVSEVTLRVIPAFNLRERTWLAPFEECMEQLDDQIAGNEHFEFFWSPRQDACLMKTLNSTDEEPREAEPGLALANERVGRSYEIFPSERNTKFNETEFALPAEQGVACLREMRRLMLEKHTNVNWPLEFRTVAADDLYLSPAHGRSTVTIAAHQGYEKPHEAFFADAQAIFRNHKGRPHWGKMHAHTAEELRALYPKWDAFHTIREELDPKGTFLNGHLRQVLF